MSKLLSKSGLAEADAPTASPAPPPNWDFIGQCYDVLYVDPFELGDKEPYPLPANTSRTGCKSANAFSLVANQPDKGHPDVLVPAQTDYSELNETDHSSTKNVINASAAYMRKLSASISVSAGVDGLFAGSHGATWKGLAEGSSDATSINTLTTATRRSYELTLKNLGSTDPSQIPPLESGFADALWAAADPSSSATFEAFVQQYGTHFSSQTTFGGLGRQVFSLTSVEAMEMIAHAVNIDSQATATIKLVEFGRDINAGLEISDLWTSATSQQSSKLELYGGQAGLDYQSWLPTVDAKPTVVAVNLLRHDSLIHFGYFSNETAEDIALRQQTLNERIEAYISSNGIDLSSSTIESGDNVCLFLLPISVETPTNKVPPCLTQPSGDTAQTSLSEPKASSLKDFLEQPTKYEDSFWQVSSNSSGAQGAPLNVFSEFCLRNLGTQVLLDAEGAKENYGYVSAGKGVTHSTDPQGWDSVTWTIARRLGAGDPQAPIQSGDVVVIARMFTSPNTKRDPDGYLRGTNNLVFSNGQIYSGSSPITVSTAWQIVKAPNTESVDPGNIRVVEETSK